MERQFHRLASHVSDGDIYVVANNTSGRCLVPSSLPAVVFTEADLEGMGLARGVDDSMVWYNVDYPLYHFVKIRPNNDYIMIFEYYAVVNTSVDDLIAAVHRNKTDLVGLTKGVTSGAWMWQPSCGELYQAKDIRKHLLPIAVFSRRAVTYLFERRLIVSEMLRQKQISRWPHCEAFIPTELALGGYKIEELAEFGSTASFDYHPAYLENDVDLLVSETFVHPVLDEARYAASTIKYQTRPERFFHPASDFHRQLARLPIRFYLRPLLHAFLDRIMAIPEVFARRVWQRAH
ncbi:MAG: hypothetical protein H7Z10_07495 [Gemmatimonadaceae bacterium]|nr:hypothetical protein [Acetobacteraceae bacterium]